MKKGQPTDVPGLYRLSENQWTLRLKASVGGVTREKAKAFKGTKSEALAALAELRESLRSTEQPQTTLGACAQQWLASLVKKGRARAAFVETRTQYLERFILPRFGHRDPSTIRPAEIDSWKDDLLDARTEADEPYAHDTLLTVWGTLKLLMRWVTVARDLRANPMTDLRFDIEGPRGPPKAALTRDEVAAVLDGARWESPDVRAMMILGFATGARFCELSAYEWGDLDWARGTIEIRRSQVGGVLGPPKTEATRRLSYLPPEVLEMLRAHLAWQREQGHVMGDTLFPSRAGTYRFPAMLIAPLGRCAARGGVKKRLTAHCIRKTTNNLIRKAAGDVVARSMVGHATPDMTLRYSQVDQEEALRALEQAFRTGPAVGPAQ